MIKHIVMFKLKEYATEAEKKSVQTQLKDKLASMKGKVELLRSIEVGANFAESPFAFDVVLVSDFDNKTDLKAYATHPEHVKVIDFVKEVTIDKHVVDYEY